MCTVSMIHDKWPKIMLVSIFNLSLQYKNHYSCNVIPAILGSVRNLRGRGVLAVCLGLNDCVKERLVPYASTIFCFSHRRHLRWKWIFQEQNWLFWRMSRLWTRMLWYLRYTINYTIYWNESFLPSFGLGANTTLVSKFVQMISLAMVLQRSDTVKKWGVGGGRG